jgi:hypothetical protein
MQAREKRQQSKFQHWKFGSHASVPSRVVLGMLPPVTTGDAAQTAFDNGLAETLNSRLGELGTHHRLVVIPMTSTVEKHVNSIDVARQEFGVNLVLVLNI